MNIYIMRHGETTWNQERRLQGQTNIELNESGIELAHITKQGMCNIPFERIYVSPLNRTRQTASIMAEETTVPIIVDDRLIEMNFGIGEGECIDEINQDPSCSLYHFLNSPEEYTPLEGGETFEDLEKRCQLFIEDILIPLEGICENILIVTHGAFLRAFILYVKKYPLSEFWYRNQHKNCAVTSFSLSGGKLTLLEEGKLYY